MVDKTTADRRTELKTTPDGSPVHPRVNPQNHNVRDLPERFNEGDVLARLDTWTDTETSHWAVAEVDESRDTTAVGYRYRLEEVGGDGAMYVNHGEIQLLAARGALRVSTGAEEGGR